MNDLSPDFVFNERDSRVCSRIIKFEGTPKAILEFAKKHHQLTDYCYWFMLGTLWVSHTDGTDLSVWKSLFKSSRANRTTSLMKPSELRDFENLPDEITAYRAHRPGETDWIAYTLDPYQCVRFCLKRKADHIVQYKINKSDCFAHFTRRAESEIVVLDKALPLMVRDHGVLTLEQYQQRVA